MKWLMAAIVCGLTVFMCFGADFFDKDTIYLKNSDICFIKIPKELRGKAVDSSLTDGSFDKWVGELKKSGFEWTGSFGFVGASLSKICIYIPFRKRIVE